MKAAIYCRVSTDEQARSGYSLSSQVDACRAHAKTLGAIFIEEYIDDGYSGEFLDRPQLSRMRDNLRNKYDIVVVYDPDRLARKLAHQLVITEEIERSGSQLIFVSVTFEASPEGKLFYSIRGAIAEFEKEKIKERTSRGKYTKALQGKLTFMDNPFGYKANADRTNYCVVEEEARAVRLIFQLLTEKQYGLRMLRFDLAERGVFTRAGKPFNATMLQRMLRNPMYAGTKMAFRKRYKTIGQHKIKAYDRDPAEWVPIPVPALVSKELWDRAQAVLSDNKKYGKRNTKSDYLIRNIIRCDSCGYTMTAIRNKSGENYYYYYTCPSHSERRECDNRHIPSDLIDKEVWEYIYNLAKLDRLEELYPNEKLEENKTESFKRQIAGLHKKQEAIISWVTDGTVSIDKADTDLKKIAKDIVALNALIAVKQPPRISNVSAEEIIKATSFEQKRNIILRLGISIIARRTKDSELRWNITL